MSNIDSSLLPTSYSTAIWTLLLITLPSGRITYNSNTQVHANIDTYTYVRMMQYVATHNAGYTLTFNAKGTCQQRYHRYNRKTHVKPQNVHWTVTTAVRTEGVLVTCSTARDVRNTKGHTARKASPHVSMLCGSGVGP